ncbi:MAG: hypothetical protein DRJ49_03460 [Thermoprotei archaeon]|nr:MAG: hypothetical protein DRN53_03860 [Thermoprotei archaeon]RLE89304.1 MAG: hypothetical protein DRJ49_03460 [Thermoprotei archaeon]
MNILKDRIEACIEIWSNILQRPRTSRPTVVELLKRTYERKGIEPIRGKTKIKIYDKEMITLYLVGKYGLGVFDEKLHSEIFSKEVRVENIVNEILSGNPIQLTLEKYFGKISEDIVFRVLRLCLTKVLFNWESEETLKRMLDLFEKEFPRLEYKFRTFKRFYIALVLARSIVEGKVKDRLEKEALKHSLCMRFSAIKCAPSDSFIRDIAVNVFKGNEREVNKVLSTKDEIELKIE